MQKFEKILLEFNDILDIFSAIVTFWRYKI